jgi:hypothetical protein
VESNVNTGNCQCLLECLTTVFSHCSSSSSRTLAQRLSITNVSILREQLTINPKGKNTFLCLEIALIISSSVSVILVLLSGSPNIFFSKFWIVIVAEVNFFLLYFALVLVVFGFQLSTSLSRQALYHFSHAPAISVSKFHISREELRKYCTRGGLGMYFSGRTPA